MFIAWLNGKKISCLINFPFFPMLQWPSTHQCTIHKARFRVFWMGWNPTQPFPILCLPLSPVLFPFIIFFSFLWDLFHLFFLWLSFLCLYLRFLCPLCYVWFQFFLCMCVCVCFEFCVCGALEEEDKSSMKGRRETKRQNN